MEEWTFVVLCCRPLDVRLKLTWFEWDKSLPSLDFESMSKQKVVKLGTWAGGRRVELVTFVLPPSPPPLPMIVRAHLVWVRQELTISWLWIYEHRTSGEARNMDRWQKSRIGYIYFVLLPVTPTHPLLTLYDGVKNSFKPYFTYTLVVPSQESNAFSMSVSFVFS